MTTTMLIASIAWLLLCLGYLKRRQRSVHVPLVLSGIFLDIVLISYLELTRGAVEKALQFDLSILAQIHIGFSTLAALLYLPVIYFGGRILRGDQSAATRRRHRKFALACLAARTLGFLFMFSMWK